MIEKATAKLLWLKVRGSDRATVAWPPSRGGETPGLDCGEAVESVAGGCAGELAPLTHEQGEGL